MNKSFRYGCHPFINAQPLIYPLVKNYIDHPFELIFDSPAQIALSLKTGALDLGFIPSIEYIGSNYLLIPDYSISSKGKVKSVLLFSKTNISKITSIALDCNSKTSVAMLKILLKKKYGIAPTLCSMKPDLTTMLKECDAALIIGDNALCIADSMLQVYDLGYEWFELTQTVFVHAVLAVRSEVDLQNSTMILKQAKKKGLEQIPAIAREISTTTAIPYKECLTYLTQIINYDLQDDGIEGLQTFYSLARECGLIDTTNEQITFYSEKKPTARHP